MADGSVSIKVDAETKQAQKELAKLERDLQKTATALEKTGTGRNAIVEQLEEARAKAEETRSAIEAINEERNARQARMTAAGPGQFTSDDWSKHRSEMEVLLQKREELTKELAIQEKAVTRLEGQEEKITNKLREQEETYERQTQQVGEMRASLMQTGGQAMQKIKAGADNVTKAFNKGFKNILKWGFGIRSLFILVRRLRNGIKEGFQGFVEKDPETKANVDALKASLNGLKLAWGAAFAPVYNVVAPILKKLVDWLITAANAVNQFFSALAGKKTYKKAAASMDSVAKSATGAGDAAEEAKKQIMGFDEINRLDDNKSSGGGGAGASAGLGDIEETVINPKILSLLDWVKKHLLEIELIAGTIGAVLLAWKLSNLLGTDFKRILGIIMMIYGAVLLVKGAIDAWQNGINWDNLRLMIGGIAVAATGAALAFGTVGAAITLLIGGITLLVVGFHEWIKTGELTDETLAALVVGFGLVGAALALFALKAGIAATIAGALNVSILAVVASIALIVAGIGLLVVGILEWIHTGELSQRTFQIINAGILLVAGGIALLTGSWIPLLIAGVAILVLTVIKNWDKIKDKTIEIWNSIKEWVTENWEAIKEKAVEIWTGIKDSIVEVFEGVKEGIAYVWDSITSWFEDKWDALKSWWESLSLNPFNIMVPHLSWEWEEAGGVVGKILSTLGLPSQIPHLNVSWFAKGGIVDGATLIGAGENGKEAIIPLERNTEWIRNLATELLGMMESRFDRVLPGMPAMAMGSVVPPRAVSGGSVGFSEEDISRLIAGIQGALTGNDGRTVIENKVYLDGKQLSDSVTKWQRRDDRSRGI